MTAFRVTQRHGVASLPVVIPRRIRATDLMAILSRSLVQNSQLWAGGW
jgi:hypothetical protein